MHIYTAAVAARRLRLGHQTPESEGFGLRRLGSLIIIIIMINSNDMNGNSNNNHNNNHNHNSNNSNNNNNNSNDNDKDYGGWALAGVVLFNIRKICVLLVCVIGLRVCVSARRFGPPHVYPPHPPPSHRRGERGLEPVVRGFRTRTIGKSEPKGAPGIVFNLGGLDCRDAKCNTLGKERYCRHLGSGARPGTAYEQRRAMRWTTLGKCGEVRWGCRRDVRAEARRCVSGHLVQRFSASGQGLLTRFHVMF